MGSRESTNASPKPRASNNNNNNKSAGYINAHDCSSSKTSRRRAITHTHHLDMHIASQAELL